MRTSQGLSLIEVLVAFSIISIVFLALAMSQTTGFRVTRDAIAVSTARDIASRQIEIIRGYGYVTYGRRAATTTTPVYAGCATTSPSGSGQDIDAAGFIPRCSGTDNAITNFPNYVVSWSITPSDDVPATDPPALYDVEVRAGRGNTNYVLSTYLSCADAGELSVTGVPCPRQSLLTP